MGLIAQLVASERKKQADHARNWLRMNLAWQFTGFTPEGNAVPPDARDTWYVFAREYAEAAMQTDEGAIALLARIRRR